jgi:hypothetical protein
LAATVPASVVARSEIALTRGVILFSGFAKPFHRLHFVFRDAFTLQVTEAQIVLSLGVILLGGFAILLRHLDMCRLHYRIEVNAKIHALNHSIP